MSNLRKHLRDMLVVTAGVVLVSAGTTGAFTFQRYLLHEISLICAVFGLALIVRTTWKRLRDGIPDKVSVSQVLPLASRVVPLLVVVVATCGVYSYLFLGEMPWSHDHPVHLFKAWQLGERLIPSGRLMGWSHYLWTGYPAETLYPVLGDLLVVVFRWLSLGFAPWPMAYAWALLTVILLYHLGIYAIGCRWFGPWAGALGAIFALLDRGAPREGAYYWTIHYGVWPMALGTALWFFAFERLLAVLERPTRGRIAALAALQALALLGHPMTIMFTIVIYPAALVLHMLQTKREHIALPVWATVAALGLSAALAAFWYLPFLAASEFVARFGGAWWALPEIGERLREAEMFDHTWRLPIALGIGGAVLAWARRDRHGRDVTILLGILMLAASSTVFEALDLGNVHEKFDIIHFRRFSYPMKMMWFLLAGYALLGAAGEALKQTSVNDHRGAQAPWRRWVWMAMAVIVFVPIVESLSTALFYKPIDEISTPKPLSEQKNSKAFSESNAWFLEHTGPTDPFFRIAYEVGGSRHLFNAAPVFTGRPAINLPVDVPATSFTRRFRNNSASTMALQNVRYAVAVNDFLEKRKDLKEILRTDYVRIYEFKDYKPDPFTVEGEARVKLLEFDDERIRLRVEEPAPGDRLTLHVTQMDEWHAYIDGRPLPIKIVEGNRQVRWLMSVPLGSEGVLEFLYERGAPEAIGTSMTLFALGFLVLIAFGRRLTQRVWLSLPGHMKTNRILARISEPALAIVIVACAGAIAFFLISRKPPPGSYRLSDHLHEARVTAETEKMHFECVRMFDRRFKCENGQTRYIYKGAKRSGSKESRILSGILIRPFNELHTNIGFPDVTLGRNILVRCGTDYLSNSGKGNVDIHFYLDKEHIGRIMCPASGNWKEQTLDTKELAGKTGTLLVDVANVKKRQPRLIIDAWVID